MTHPTIQQERVSLCCWDNLVIFHWPFGSDEVTITRSLGQPRRAVYSVEEAHELFDALVNAGAY